MRKTCQSKQRFFARTYPLWIPCFAAFVLTACVPPDYPEDPRLSDESNLPEPDIIPLSDILNTDQTTDVAQDTATDLQARGEDLRRRADTVRNTVPE